MSDHKRVGYTAGVYDMFHIGHLNLLKNAKKQCDYLIVGVNSDDATYGYKQKYPVIPEEERCSIVEAIKYVDKVVLVNNTDKIHAYEVYKPDMIIVGNDHKNEPKWKTTDDYLRQRGSEVVFLPYTEHTSSTKLRDVKDARIIEGDF